LIPKDMTHKGRDGLMDWFRSTWMPYWEQVPEKLRPDFFDEIADDYLARYPLDAGGMVHVPSSRAFCARVGGLRVTGVAQCNERAEEGTTPRSEAKEG